MGMIGMGLMMVFAIVVLLVISTVGMAAVSWVARGGINQWPGYDGAEKPKRDRLILSDDGELREITDYEGETDEKPKRGHI